MNQSHNSYISHLLLKYWLNYSYGRYSYHYSKFYSLYEEIVSLSSYYRT